MPKKPYRKLKKNQFGIDVAAFCAETAMSRREICEATNQSYASFIDCTNGRSVGYKLVPIVRKFMADYRVKAKEASGDARSNDAISIRP